MFPEIKVSGRNSVILIVPADPFRSSTGVRRSLRSVACSRVALRARRTPADDAVVEYIREILRDFVRWGKPLLDEPYTLLGGALELDAIRSKGFGMSSGRFSIQLQHKLIACEYYSDAFEAIDADIDCDGKTEIIELETCLTRIVNNEALYG